jgi:DNA-binding transcriptional regulator YiaG
VLPISQEEHLSKHCSNGPEIRAISAYCASCREAPGRVTRSREAWRQLPLWLPGCYQKLTSATRVVTREHKPKRLQFRASDIGRLCQTLSSSRAQLAARLKVSPACVSRWEKGLRIPRGDEAERLRALLADTGTSIDVSDLRAKLGMTQRVFGAQFGVSRQQVQKWEQGRAHRRQMERLVKLAAAATVVTGRWLCALQPHDVGGVPVW